LHRLLAAGNNARVYQHSILTRVQYLWRIAAIVAAGLALSIVLAGCGEQSDQQNAADTNNGLTETVAGWLGLAEDHTAIDKLRALADDKCHQGNQPACDTIFQLVGDKVAIESTDVLPTLTPACNAGKHDACQQLAVLRAELSSWCATNNQRACAAVNIGPWPQNLDVPALVDSAKLDCLNSQLKADSATCHSLKNF